MSKLDERAQMRIEEGVENGLAYVVQRNWATARALLEQCAAPCATREWDEKKLPEFAPGDLPLDDPGLSASLIRGLLIYSLFEDGEVLGVADIADELGEARSTTHRYLTTLVRVGMLAQEPSRKYRLA